MTALAAKLKEKGISQNRVAALAGTSKQFVSSVLKGQRPATPKIISAINALTSTMEGEEMPKETNTAPKVNQPPVMIIDKMLEIQPTRELVDPVFCQISPQLTDDVNPDVAAEHQEILRIRELIDHHSPDVPDVYLLKLGPKRFWVLRGSTAAKAYKNYGIMPAWCYKAVDSDLPFIAGLK
ncbi:MAG: helix-turn-helix transcriptional regulator [Deltaproteobacteria bacterium]|jgi:transcriptional regulator with XRE-family HTH domain|nr:helix-turn-helix transcriptional regulator [Deltaproteobacteria bacterium]